MSKEPSATSNGRSEYVFRLNISKLLDVAAKAKDSTGAAISRRTGISESSVYRILAGEAQPDLNSAMRIAETYDIDLRELIKRASIEVAA
ncbi:helix-turn-helix transcriptional regulator [Streptomyces sp. NPDC052077]|uniref:helix-turn-helix domain-containing protein n=1 Tax=Streptomyces sp. NPDC052077 TaxID=3154757 RepID=UPI00343681CB